MCVGDRERERESNCDDKHGIRCLVCWEPRRAMQTLVTDTDPERMKNNMGRVVCLPVTGTRKSVVGRRAYVWMSVCTYIYICAVYVRPVPRCVIYRRSVKGPRHTHGIDYPNQDAYYTQINVDLTLCISIIVHAHVRFGWFPGVSNFKERIKKVANWEMQFRSSPMGAEMNKIEK